MELRKGISRKQVLLRIFITGIFVAYLDACRHSDPVKVWGLRRKQLGDTMFISASNPHEGFSANTIRRLISQLDADPAIRNVSLQVFADNENRLIPWPFGVSGTTFRHIDPPIWVPMPINPASAPQQLKEQLRAAWYLRVRDKSDLVWHDGMKGTKISQVSGRGSPRILSETSGARIVLITEYNVGIVPEIRWFIQTPKLLDALQAVQLTRDLVSVFGLEMFPFQGRAFLRTDSDFQAHIGPLDLVDPFRNTDIAAVLENTYWDCHIEAADGKPSYRCETGITKDLPGLRKQ